MPTIAELVAKNEHRIANLPKLGEGGSPIIARPVTLPISAPAAPTFPGTPELPLRSTFPPNLFATDSVTAGSNPVRPAIRSGIWSNDEKVSNDSTPTTLSNKKLVTPIIGGGSKLSRYNSIKAKLTPQLVNANSSATQTFTVAGIQASDKLSGYQWNVPQTVGVITLAVRVVGTNKIALDFYNPTGGNLTPTGGSLTLFLLQ